MTKYRVQDAFYKALSDVELDFKRDQDSIHTPEAQHRLHKLLFSQLGFLDEEDIESFITHQIVGNKRGLENVTFLPGIKQQDVELYMKQLRTLCQWIPGLEANYKAGAFLASGFNAEKPGFVNLDEFLPVSLPPLDPDPFTSPLPGYLPKEENVDQELLQFTVGLVNLYINTIPFTGVENVNAYLKDVTLTILMNRTAFLHGFRDMLNRINDVLHEYDNRYLLDLPKPSGDSDSLWHGLEPTEQRIDSLGVGGIKRVRLPSANDGLILFGNSQPQPISIDTLSWSDLSGFDYAQSDSISNLTDPVKVTDVITTSDLDNDLAATVVPSAEPNSSVKIDLFSDVMASSNGEMFSTRDGKHTWNKKQFFGRKLLSQALAEQGHVHGDDHFNHLIFKYTPEYLDAKIEVHYGTKSMAQLVAAMFLR